MPYNNLARTQIIDCFGDSLTLSTGIYGVQADQYWPARLRDRLIAQALPIGTRNWGQGGDTSWNVMGRMTDPAHCVAGAGAVVFIGANDVGLGITQTQTQYNIQAIVKALNWGCSFRAPRYPTLSQSSSYANPAALPASVVGYRAYVATDNDATGGLTPTIAGNVLNGSTNPIVAVWECHLAATGGVAGWGRVGIGQCFYGTQASLPFQAKAGMRAVVLNDTSTTGGAAANTLSTIATITGTNTSTPAQSVWECRNGASGETGWGRIAISGTAGAPLGNRVAVHSLHYLNFTTVAGDQIATPLATYATIRAAQLAAATAEGVLFVDYYNYYKGLIGTAQANYFGGTYDRSKGPHVADVNQHMNELGNELVAEYLYVQLLAAQWFTQMTPTAVGF